MYLKRLLAFLCCFTLVFCLFPSSAFATGGNGNIDGGGGSMGHGTSSNFWNSGNDGVRITVRLARKGLVTESEYNDLQLWYFNGHTMSCWFGPLGVDGTGSLYGLIFDYQTASPTKTQFYLLDDYYRVMNHLTE